jgi:hypothetical protein
MASWKIVAGVTGAAALIAAGGAAVSAGAATGTSASAAPSATDGLAVCVTRSTGEVRAAVSACTKKEYRLVLGKTGERGARGPQGERGARGPQGAQGPQGPQGPSTLYWNEFTTNGGYGKPIPNAPAEAHVVEIEVPAGSYLFGFTATVENVPPYTRASITCQAMDGTINPLNVDMPEGVNRMRYVLNQPLVIPTDRVITVKCTNSFSTGDLSMYYATVTMLRVGELVQAAPVE